MKITVCGGTLFGLSVCAVIFFFIAIPAARADTSPPSHFCVQPAKQTVFSSKGLREKYVEDVRVYKACIEQFVEEQKAAVKVHHEAAEAAIKEFNDFVKESQE